MIRTKRRPLPIAAPLEDVDTSDLPPMPRTRADCASMPRPCPFLRCEHHLALDVNHVGTVWASDDLDLEAMPETCTLDVVERGENHLREVAVALGVKWQSVQKAEESAMRKLRRNPEAKRILADMLELAANRPAPHVGDALDHGETKELNDAIDAFLMRQAVVPEAAE